MKYKNKEDLIPLFTPKVSEKPVEDPAFKFCELTGEVFPANGFCGYGSVGYSTINVYGHRILANRISEEYKKLVWLRDLLTCVYREDPALKDDLVIGVSNNPRFAYLKYNEEQLFEDDILVMAADTGNYVDKDDAYYANDTRDYYECHSNVRYIEDEGFYVTVEIANDDYYCHDCGDWYSYPEESDSGSLGGHDERADQEFGFFTAKGRTGEPLPKQLYFGVEIELEYREDDVDNDAVCEAVRSHSFLACEDGSLDHGVELKSAPMSFDIIRENVGKALVALKNVAPVRGDSTCGVHIHVSRAGLTDLQVGYIQEFIYAKPHQDFITYVAERESNNYCRREHEYKKTDRISSESMYDALKDDIIRKIKHKSTCWEDRYQCMNVLGDHTVEFRLFQGTSKHSTITKYIEFVKALIELTAVSNRDKDVSVDTFIKYVRKHRKTFPELWDCVKKYAESEGKSNLVDFKATRGVPKKLRKQKVSEGSEADKKQARLLEVA